jgi:hypothetical protein
MELRVKLTLTEFKDLEKRAKGANAPSVPAFARSLLFPEHDYPSKWQEVTTYINSLSSGATFYVRDALPNTPPLIGRWVYERQQELGIELSSKDRKGTNIWRKK